MDNRFSINKNGITELRIILQKRIVTYLNYSTPLCCLLWDENASQWVNEHFLNTYCTLPEKGRIWTDYLEELNFYKDIADESIIAYDAVRSIGDILNFIKTKIRNGYYAYTYLDAFYISSNSNYKKKHNCIQSTLYGFNDDEKYFNSLGFTEGLFKKYNISYDEMTNGFSSTMKLDMESLPVWVKWYTITLVKPKLDSNYQFNIKNYLQSLNSYISGDDKTEKLRPEVKVEFSANAFYGHNVNEQVIKCMKDLYGGKFAIDYRSVHLLAEHKKFLNDSLNFIAEQYHIENELAPFQNSFFNIINEYENARLIYLKNVYMDSNYTSIYGQLHNKQAIVKIIDAISRGSEIELSVLTNVYTKLTGLQQKS